MDEDDIKAKVQEQINANKYPMAIKTNKTDYIGVLYQFIEEDGKVKIEPLTNDVNGLDVYKRQDMDSWSYDCTISRNSFKTKYRL